MINVLINNTRNYPIDKLKIKQQVEKTLDTMKVVGDVELSVTFIGDRKMKDLNSAYRHKDRTTDVLSFPLEEYEKSSGFVVVPDNVLRLGDIVISYSQAIENAHEQNAFVNDEINFLVEHSIHHLLGIHHEGD